MHNRLKSVTVVMNRIITVAPLNQAKLKEGRFSVNDNLEVLLDEGN